jgi:hypothetical protein
MEISVHEPGNTHLGRQPSTKPEPAKGQCPEPVSICQIQIFYGRFLDLLTKLGFALLLITFALYIFGILSNFVPRQLLPNYWGLSLPRYLEMTQMPTGWAWIWELPHGDILNLVPIVFLTGITIICLLTVTVRFFRSRETLQGIVAILEILALLAAASGILKAGGH